MKKSFSLFCSLISLLSFFTFSCQHELLPSPKNETTTEQNQNPDTIIGTVPENLVATHGLKGKIELTWQGVQSSVRYNIYEAPTPYDRFTQIAETTSNTTSYTLTEKSGSSKYYKVTAVDRNNNESPFSIVAHGTTLAIPVITYIGQDEQNSDSACSVHWYMNNCNSATYQQNVRYVINCFDPQGNNVEEKVHDGNADYPSITFENLTPNTNYSYQITAYIVTHQNDTEVSDKADASTARRLRPNAPENLSATLGTSTTENTLTFDLPAMVDVALGNGIYEPKPLYFKIYRKFAEEEDIAENWKIIESKFDQTVFGTQYTPSSPDTPYEPGQTVTYTDTKDLKRGVMYDYKVQSYADETPREISSNLSFATTQGFLMAVPKFETANYEVTRDYKGTADESDDVYTQVKTGFSFSWDMLGYEKDYAFILSEKRYKLEVDNAGEKDEIGDLETYEYFTTIESVNEKVRIFDLTDESNIEQIRGYYTYKLYIITNSDDNFILLQPGESITNPICEIPAFGTTLVTQDTTAPEITGFNTQDGYSNKILISWNYDETITKYTLSYELPDGTINEIEDFSAIIDGAAHGEQITYTHDVESGFNATYTLTALRGISVSTDPVKLFTLGTPTLTFDKENPKYDTISVNWNPVNKVDSYELSYSVDGTNYSETISIPVPQEGIENPENFVVNPDNSYTYNFIQPTTYDDASIAGNDIQVKIQAKNTLDSTTNNVTTRLLGPALTEVKAKAAEFSDRIIVKFSPVQGAKKYLIKRDRYTVDNSSLESSDFYYVSTDGKSISVQNEEGVTESQLSISLGTDLQNNPQFVLTDYSYENSENTKWKVNQDKINWGFPYHYTVFPLENENDSFDEETQSLAAKVTYQNLSQVEAIGSALGYGHNVTATKSEDPRFVTITWTKPYLSTTLTYSPVLWRSESGKNSWERAGVSLDSSGEKFVFEPKYNQITKINERITPYDFAVMYEDTTSKPNQSYLDDMAKNVDENNEAINKGYAFSIETSAQNVTVDGVAGYQEKITWKYWDYTKRAKGPKQDAVYTVNMRNNNLGADWKNVATYTNDGTITINNPSEYETSITTQGTNEIIITPNNLASDDSALHNGLLKVLRDYKHYAQVLVTRENSSGQTITASFADDEENMYAYREVSPGEFARIATLPMAIGIRAAVNNQGIKWTGGQSGSASAENPGAGSVKIKTYGGAVSDVRSDVNFTNYKPVLTTNAGTQLTFVTIGTSTLYGNTNSWYGTDCPEFWKTASEGNMLITGPSDVILYSGEIYFVADMYPDSTDKIKVLYNGKTTTLKTQNYCAIPFEGTGWLDDTGVWK